MERTIMNDVWLIGVTLNVFVDFKIVIKRVEKCCNERATGGCYCFMGKGVREGRGWGVELGGLGGLMRVQSRGFSKNCLDH